MKKFALAIFVKTPGLSPIKTRLAQDLGTDGALKVYRKCLKIIEQKISKVSESSSFQVNPFWAVAEKQGLDHPLWKSWPKIFQGSGDLGDRLNEVYFELLKTHDGVLLMGADSPLFPEEEIIKGIEWLSTHPKGVAIGPTLDGGFYFVGSRMLLDKSLWTNVTYSSPHTLQEFVEHLPSVADKFYLDTHWDVDTMDDLKRLQQQLPTFMEG